MNRAIFSMYIAFIVSITVSLSIVFLGLNRHIGILIFIFTGIGIGYWVVYPELRTKKKIITNK